MKPEISKVQFSVTGYYIAARDLFIVGSAVEGMDATKALKNERGAFRTKI